MQKNSYLSPVKTSNIAIILALGVALSACNSDVSNDSGFDPVTVSYTHLTLPTKRIV